VFQVSYRHSETTKTGDLVSVFQHQAIPEKNKVVPNKALTPSKRIPSNQIVSSSRAMALTVKAVAAKKIGDHTKQPLHDDA